MPSTINELVFSEPSGRNNAIVPLFGSLALLSMYLYYEIRHGGPFNGLLILGIAFGLHGVVNLLPPTRQYIAGVLRIIVVFMIIGLFILAILAPGVVLPH